MAVENKFIRSVFARHGARPDLRIFRNASAKVWVGKFKFRATAHTQYALQPGDVVLEGGRLMTAGLAEGSADLIGIQAPLGRFVSLELKTEHTSTKKHQVNWLEMVRRFGGLAGIARDMDEVDAMLGPRP